MMLLQLQYSKYSQWWVGLKHERTFSLVWLFHFYFTRLQLVKMLIAVPAPAPA